MEARILKAVILTAALGSLGASYRTANFVVTSSSPEAAQRIGRAAEKFRRELAIEWIGEEMPAWAQPCPITAQVAPNLGAGGATSFLFEHGEVFGWQMNIQGSLERILDSVLPHEVTHTIFATHFRQPLPRWADEGACTTVEHPSERAKQQMMLVDFLRNNRGIPFNRMFAMTEYPHDIMPLYSQGYSVARYLIAQGGRRKFLDFLADGLSDKNWTRATKRWYGFENIASLQTTWNEWVRVGSPKLDQPAPAVGGPSLAQASRRARPAPNLIYRGQNASRGASTASKPATRSVYQPRDSESKQEGAESDDTSANEARAVPWRGQNAQDSQAQSSSIDVQADASEPLEKVSLSQPRQTPDALAESPRRVLLEWSRDAESAPRISRGDVASLGTALR